MLNRRCARDPVYEAAGAYRNCGTLGTLIGGIANGGTFDALPIPLGSTLLLLMPPMLAGPGGMPLIGTFPAPAWPAIFANDATGVAMRSNATAILTDVFDIEDSMISRATEATMALKKEQCRPALAGPSSERRAQRTKHSAVFDLQLLIWCRRCQRTTKRSFTIARW